MSILKKRLFDLLLVSVLSFNSILLAEDWKLQKELYEAIKKDDIKKIEFLLEKNPKLINKKIKYHSYPVLDAASLGSIKALKLLVEKGGNLKNKSKTGNSILHIAVIGPSVNMKKKEAVLDYLINEKKLDVEVRNKEKQTPFHFAFSSEIYFTRPKRAIAFIELFDKYGANLNAQDASGATVLNYLAKSCKIRPDEPEHAAKTIKSSLGVVKVLVGKGADVNLVDNLKQTPLVLFLLRTRKYSDTMKVDYVRFLMESGTNIKLKTKKREKALKLVEKKGELYNIMKKKYKKK